MQLTTLQVSLHGVCFALKRVLFFQKIQGTDSVTAGNLNSRHALNLYWVWLFWSLCRLCIIFTPFGTKRALRDGDIFFNKILLECIFFCIPMKFCPFQRQKSQKLSFSLLSCFFLIFFLWTVLKALMLKEKRNFTLKETLNLLSWLRIKHCSGSYVNLSQELIGQQCCPLKPQTPVDKSFSDQNWRNNGRR